MVEPDAVVALAERGILLGAGAPEDGWPVGATVPNGPVDARLVVMAAMPRVMEGVLRDASAPMLNAGDADCLRLFMGECVRRLSLPLVELLTPGLDAVPFEERRSSAIDAMSSLEWDEYLAAETIIDPEAPMSAEDEAWPDWIGALRVAASNVAAAEPAVDDSAMHLAARLVLPVDAHLAGDCLPDVSAGLIAAEAWPGAGSASMTFDEAVCANLHYTDTLCRIDDPGEAPAPGSVELRRIISDAKRRYDEAMRGERYVDAIRIISDLPHTQGTPGTIDDWLVGARPEPPLSADDIEVAILRGAYPMQLHEAMAARCRAAMEELEQCRRDVGLLAAYAKREAR